MPLLCFKIRQELPQFHKDQDGCTTNLDAPPGRSIFSSLWKKPSVSEVRSAFHKPVDWFQQCFLCTDMATKRLQATFLAALVLIASSWAFSHHQTDTTAADQRQSPSQNDSLLVTAFQDRETVHRQRRGFPLEEDKPGEDLGIDKTGFYSLSKKRYELYGILFGHLLLKNQLKRKGAFYRCEGVLIGPKHVLTVYPECFPAGAGSAYAGMYHNTPVDAATEQIVFQYTKKGGGKVEKAAVIVESMWRTVASKYLIALLADDPILTKLSTEQFPLLTWTKQDALNNYDIYLEMVNDYPVLLSTPTATQDLTNYEFNGNLRTFLSKSEYEKNPTMISLKRGGIKDPDGYLDGSVKVGGVAMPLNGAAFFKPAEETAAVLGFTSQEFTDQCYDDSFNARLAIGGKRKRPTKRINTYHCGHRMDWEDVKNLYEIGLAVDDGMPRDNGVVFPHSPTGILHLIVAKY